VAGTYQAQATDGAAKHAAEGGSGQTGSRRSRSRRGDRNFGPRGEAYAAHLGAAGVPVTSVHDFVMLNALKDTHAAMAAITQGGEFLRTALWGK
jgi:acetyl esterase/lipase